MQHPGDNLPMQNITKWVIEFHCLSSLYSESKRRSLAKNDREKKRGGGNHCRIL